MLNLKLKEFEIIEPTLYQEVKKEQLYKKNVKKKAIELN